MSDNVYDFGEILAQAQKKKQASNDEGTTPKVRLNGTFKAKVVFARGDEETTKGFPQIGLIWEVQEGPQKDSSTWMNIVFSPKSLARGGKTLLSLGVPAEKLSSLSTKGLDLSADERNSRFTDGLCDIAEDLLGLEAEIKVRPQASNANFDDFEILGLLSGSVVGAPASGPAFDPSAFSTNPASTVAAPATPGAFLPNV